MAHESEHLFRKERHEIDSHTESVAPLLLAGSADTPLMRRQWQRKDPGTIVGFLRGLCGVVEASAWIDDDRLVAYVEIGDGCLESEASLRNACAFGLGLHLVPTKFRLAARKTLAA